MYVYYMSDLTYTHTPCTHTHTPHTHHVHTQRHSETHTTHTAHTSCVTQGVSECLCVHM